METATYHSPNGPRKLVVLRDNKDGSVDLGTVDGVGKETLEIGKCQLTTGSLIGSCTRDAKTTAVHSTKK